MHFWTAVVALSAAATVSAKGRLGYAVGVRNKDSSCKGYDEFKKDFDVLTGLKAKGQIAPEVVRTYSAIDHGADDVGGAPCTVPDPILKAARDAGIKVILGLWGDSDDSFQKESKAITDVLDQDSSLANAIYAFTVGSEGLYRNEQKEGTGYEAKDILRRINAFKDTITGPKYKLKQKVGTADSWNKFQDGTADDLITGGVNLLLVNAFGYWQSQDISNASATYLDDLQQAYGHIQSVAGSTDSIELWNGETGWPTNGGTNYHDDKYSGTAVAGTDNAQTFYKEGVCAALDWNFDVFYFEAFGEPWKPNSNGLNGQPGDEKHWGAFDADRVQVVQDLSCNYS